MGYYQQLGSVLDLLSLFTGRDDGFRVPAAYLSSSGDQWDNALMDQSCGLHPAHCPDLPNFSYHLLSSAWSISFFLGQTKTPGTFDPQAVSANLIF